MLNLNRLSIYLLTLGMVIVISTQLIATDSIYEEPSSRSSTSSTPQEGLDFFLTIKNQVVERFGANDVQFGIPEFPNVTSKFLACSEDDKKGILLHFIQQNPDITKMVLHVNHFEKFQDILTMISKQQLNGLCSLHIKGNFYRTENPIDDMIAPISEFKNLQFITIYYAVLSKCPPVQGLTNLQMLSFNEVTFKEKDKVFKEIEDVSRSMPDLTVHIKPYIFGPTTTYKKGISTTTQNPLTQ